MKNYVRAAWAGLAAVALFAVAAPAMAGSEPGDWTVTARAGVVENDNTVVGIGAGYQLTDHFGVEVTYDQVMIDNFSDASALSVNATARLPLTENFAVTAAAGIGTTSIYNYDEATWTVGLGAEYEVNDKWVIEARYRRVEGFDSGYSVDAYTLGAGYRF